MGRSLLCFWFAVLSVLSTQAAWASVPRLIPRKLLFSAPSKSFPEISPDGKHLAYLAPDENHVVQIWVVPVGRHDARKVTASKKRNVSRYWWTCAPDTLAYLQDPDGEENSHLYLLNLMRSEVLDVTPFSGVRAELVGLDCNFPDELLLSLNKNDPRVRDVYRFHIHTRELRLDTKNPGDVTSWTCDPRFRVRAAVASLPDGGLEIRHRKDEKSAWQTAVRLGPEDADSTVVGFTPDGQSLWLQTSEGRDTQSLIKRHLQTGREDLVATEAGADATEVIYNPVTHEAEAVSFTRAREHWKFLNGSFAEDWRFLECAVPGDVALFSRDRDSRTWVVGCISDAQPTDYYLYERPSRKLTHLFQSRPALADHVLAPMRSVTIKSRDGLDLVSYLTLPPGTEPRRLPMVLLVHGGPWGRDIWRLHPETQGLANRGYAVLRVNFRGSIGFGKKFLHAGDREWAGRMQDDLIDAVHWAVDQGYADPQRIAICGSSYGGYAALVGAAFTPDVFACAVDACGPSNLVTFLQGLSARSGPLRKMLSSRVGDVEKEQDFLKARSPLFRAERIKVPVLIVQGGKDTNVKPAESERMAAALRRAGKPVEYLVFPDEGHGFMQPQSREKLFAAAEGFFAKYLGGRVEPTTGEPK